MLEHSDCHSLSILGLVTHFFKSMRPETTAPCWSCSLWHGISMSKKLRPCHFKLRSEAFRFCMEDFILVYLEATWSNSLIPTKRPSKSWAPVRIKSCQKITQKLIVLEKYVLCINSSGRPPKGNACFEGILQSCAQSESEEQLWPSNIIPRLLRFNIWQPQFLAKVTIDSYCDNILPNQKIHENRPKKVAQNPKTIGQAITPSWIRHGSFCTKTVPASTSSAGLSV